MLVVACHVVYPWFKLMYPSSTRLVYLGMSLATNVFPCLLAELLVEAMYDLRRKLFLLAAVDM